MCFLSAMTLQPTRTFITTACLFPKDDRRKTNIALQMENAGERVGLKQGDNDETCRHSSAKFQVLSQC